MGENGNIVFISTDFGHKNSNGDGNITLDDRKTDIVNIIATDIGNCNS